MSDIQAESEMSELRADEPCEHRGCLSHVTHPCENCGRIAGVKLPLAWSQYVARLEAQLAEAQERRHQYFWALDPKVRDKIDDGESVGAYAQLEAQVEQREEWIVHMLADFGHTFRKENHHERMEEYDDAYRKHSAYHEVRLGIGRYNEIKDKVMC